MIGGSKLIAGARHTVGNAHRRLLMGRALARIKRLPAGCAPDRRDLVALGDGFFNPGWTAAPSFLEELCRLVAATDGPILECGSGVTTILLGALAERTGRRILTLEHLPEWHLRVIRYLSRYGLKNVETRLSPLISYGPYEWYRRPYLPRETRFSLVVCDGPPGETRGGRYGLPEVMNDVLGYGCLVLLDDAARESELEVVRLWQARFKIEEIRRSNRYTVLSMPTKEPTDADPPPAARVRLQE